MEETSSTSDSKNTTPTNTTAGTAKPSLPLLGIGVLVVVLIGWAAFSYVQPSVPTTTPNPTLEPADASIPTTFDNPTQNLEALKSTLSKEKFLKKLYEVDRSNYNLYEKAAVHMGITPAEVQQFFYDCCDLTQESDIFADLPPVSPEFSEVAYDVSTGRLYQLDLLDEGITKQPEFYTFVDQETGVVSREFMFKPWSKPELNQWGDNGMNAMPADQYDTLSLTERRTFRAVVFVTNAWNIQNFVGINLIPDAESLNYFDITISEESTGKPYFLVGPTFPYFHNNWATKVVIEGTLKPNTPTGEYTIAINPVTPPKELNEKWSDEYKGLYAPYGFIRPSDNYVNLHVTVTD